MPKLGGRTRSASRKKGDDHARNSENLRTRKLRPLRASHQSVQVHAGGTSERPSALWPRSDAHPGRLPGHLLPLAEESRKVDRRQARLKRAHEKPSALPNHLAPSSHCARSHHLGVVQDRRPLASFTPARRAAQMLHSRTRNSPRGEREAQTAATVNTAKRPITHPSTPVVEGWVPF